MGASNPTYAELDCRKPTPKLELIEISTRPARRSPLTELQLFRFQVDPTVETAPTR